MTGAVALVQAVPLDVRTLPAVPGATATALTPLTVNVPPIATFPLESVTMLFVALEGCVTLMVLMVLMA
jgi:hypothetical protein